MEKVEPSINKWKKEKKVDLTYRSFGRVYGAVYGVIIGVLIGIMRDKPLLLCAIIGIAAGIVVGGVIGSRYKNHKKIAAMQKQGLLDEDANQEEEGERKIQV